MIQIDSEALVQDCTFDAGMTRVRARYETRGKRFGQGSFQRSSTKSQGHITLHAPSRKMEIVLELIVLVKFNEDWGVP
jgi:hypothetical protein